MITEIKLIYLLVSILKYLIGIVIMKEKDCLLLRLLCSYFKTVKLIFLFIGDVNKRKLHLKNLK